MDYGLKKFLEEASEEEIESFREHFLEEKGTVDAVEALQEENKSIKEKLAAYEMKEKAAKIQEEVLNLLKESKLPEYAKKDEGLIKSMMEAKDTDARKEIVTRMEKIISEVTKNSKITEGAAPSFETGKEGGPEPTKLEKKVLVSKVTEALSGGSRFGGRKL